MNMRNKIIEQTFFHNIILEDVKLTAYSKRDGRVLFVVLNQCISPSSVLNAIYDIIVNLDKKPIAVIIDALLFYGNTNQRFLKCEYKNNTLCSPRFIKDNNKIDLRLYGAKHFYVRPHLIEYSLLTIDEQKALKQGIII